MVEHALEIVRLARFVVDHALVSMVATIEGSEARSAVVTFVGDRFKDVAVLSNDDVPSTLCRSCEQMQPDLFGVVSECVDVCGSKQRGHVALLSLRCRPVVFHFTEMRTVGRALLATRYR